MKCSICHQNRAGSSITTIVNDPPIDICAECSETNPLVEEWFRAQGKVLEVDLILNGYDYNIMASKYKPIVTKIIGEYIPDYGNRLIFKCVKCGRLYCTPQAIRQHIKSHIKEQILEELELEETLNAN